MKIGSHGFQSEAFIDLGRNIHHMVAVKIVAGQTARPILVLDKLLMRGIEGIMFQFQILMAMLTEREIIGDTDPGMFTMTGDTELGLKPGSDFRKARLVEAVCRMVVVGPVVAR